MACVSVPLFERMKDIVGRGERERGERERGGREREREREKYVGFNIPIFPPCLLPL